MARVTYVKKAQQRYATVPVIDPETGQQKVTPVLRKDGQPRLTKSGRPVVMKVTQADKSRPLPPLKCEKCGAEILPGMPYKHVTPKSGPYGGRQRNRCQACPGWKPSELTSSEALSTLYAAQEAFEEEVSAAESISDLEAALNALAEGVREAGQVYETSADNMEDGFGHETSMSAELREKAEALDSAADEIENSASDLEEWDEDAAKVDLVSESAFEGEPDAYDWDEDPEDLAGLLADAEAEHLDAQRDAAQEAADAANAI